MTRIVLIVSSVALITVLTGCGDVEKYADMRTPMTPSAQSGPALTSERDILEQLAINRQSYIESLQQLVNYYTTSGNEMKLKWAKKELANVMASPQYSYVVEAQVAGADLRAIASIPQADQLYEDAVATEKRAYLGPVVVDDRMLRLAVEKYNQVIRQYPTSDKIAMAAFRAGDAYQHFKEYSIAAVYYERAAQWDKNIKSPARYRAAHLYDYFLHDRQKALMLYQDAIASSENCNRNIAQERVLILSKKEVPQ
jgi:tetratricopeptide (TPR) repeat protein